MYCCWKIDMLTFRIEIITQTCLLTHPKSSRIEIPQVCFFVLKKTVCGLDSSLKMWNERLISNVRQNDDGYKFLLFVRIENFLTSSAPFEGYLIRIRLIFFGTICGHIAMDSFRNLKKLFFVKTEWSAI